MREPYRLMMHSLLALSMKWIMISVVVEVNSAPKAQSNFHHLPNSGEIMKLKPFPIVSRCLPRLSLKFLCLITLILLPLTIRAQPAPALQWELVNPFRFIHDQKTVDELRTVYASLSDKTASAFERELQARADAAVDAERADARRRFDCDSPQSDVERRKCFAPYLGWGADVAKKNHEKTCWDSEKTKREFRKDGPCQDYIYPRSHRVRVWISNPETLGDGAPQWTLQPALTSRPCDAKYGRRFCVEFDVPYRADNIQHVRVTAQLATLTLSLDPGIEVKDRLIVGLGDSFAAGEGTPDIPAQFIDEEEDTDFIPAKIAGHGTTKYPQKDRGNEAIWLERRCHRSMYSYQFKTALRLALDNPQQAITYISFSCSGAVTPELVSKSQKANEGGVRLQPQLDALREVLRNGSNTVRPIDYLLLSTGGNDIGFAKYVAYILLRREWLWLSGVSDKSIDRDFKDKKIDTTLWGDARRPGNYRKLQTALFDPERSDKPKSISIAGCQTGTLCDHIILTPYPNVFTDEQGRPCEGNRLEFDEAFGRDPRRKERIELVIAKVFGELRNAQSSERIKTELGWTVIDQNADAYVKHGFCARDALSTSIGEKFQIPTWLNEDWTSFSPRDYRSYQSRLRWFRLPVDSKLTSDQHTRIFGLRIDVAFEDVTSNVMHPTAEGLARTADLNVEAIRKLERPSP